MRDGWGLRGCSGGGFVAVGEDVVVVGDRCGHDPVAVGGGTVKPCSWGLGDQSVTAELGDEA